MSKQIGNDYKWEFVCVVGPRSAQLKKSIDIHSIDVLIVEG